MNEAPLTDADLDAFLHRCCADVDVDLDIAARLVSTLRAAWTSSWTWRAAQLETEADLDNMRSRLAATEKCIEAARKVSEFLDGRWCEDHAYRDRHLEPLKTALAELDAAGEVPK